MKHLILFVVAVSACLLSGEAFPQVGDQGETNDGVSLPPPLAQRLVEIDVDSGFHANQGKASKTIFNEVIRVEGATWLRLKFGELSLANDPRGGVRSMLRITSLEDGGVQLLDSVTVEQWGRSTAYFNGDAVRVELISGAGAVDDRVEVLFAWAGIPNEGPRKAGGFKRGGVGGGFAGIASDDGDVGTDTICGSVDNRALSEDPRSARALPVGCTVFLIDDANHCFLTAGHCASGGRLEVAQFNVPLSDGNGNIRHPSPDDQYAVDPVSLQFTDAGIGNDWSYFGAFANSNTGLTPVEAQGAFYETASEPTPVDGQNIRITGYGVDSSPPEWNQVQQTHAGPYIAVEGTRLRYQTDTMGGNSGSGVQDDAANLIIGIHTHGGCSSSGGSNSGTAIDNAGLQNALANPRGVCARGLEFIYPEDRPNSIDPGGGVEFIVEVRGLNGGEPQSGTGMLHVDSGNGFQAFPMNELTANVYEASFPAVACGDTVRYFISAETIDSDVITDPLNAPGAAFTAVSAESINLVFEDDFENDLGWTVDNTSIEAGPWQRGVPSGGGNRSDPPSDFDGSGSAWVTGLAGGDNDLDGGPTRLTSPNIDLSDAPNAIVRYAFWFLNDDQDDFLRVEVSNNGGQSWTLIEQVGNTPGGWTLREFPVSSFVSPSANMRFRFSASDQPNNSVTEAGLDAFSIRVIQCGATTLNAFAVEFGSLIDGGLEELTASDDAFVEIQSSFGFSAQEPNLTETTFEFNTTNASPERLDFAVESRLDNSGGAATYRVFNFDQGVFQQVATGAIGLNEEVFEIADVDAQNRVRQSDGLVRFNVRHTVVATFSASGFRSFYDHVEAEVN